MEKEDFLVPEPSRFAFYLMLGRPERALEIANRYHGDRAIDPSSVWMPEAAQFRRLPGFDEFVENLGLVDYWKQYGWPDDCRPVGEDIQCGLSALAAGG